MDPSAFEIYANQLIELIKIEKEKFKGIEKLLEDYLEDSIYTDEIMNNMTDLAEELCTTSDRIYALTNRLGQHTYKLKDSLSKKMAIKESKHD